MAHVEADAGARQAVLDRMFQAMTELEGVVTEADARDQRMTGADSAKQQELAGRFPALTRASSTTPTRNGDVR